MPRFPVIEPETATGAAKDLFDGPLRSMQLNIFKGMANNAAILQAFLEFSSSVKSAGTLSNIEHELIALTVSVANECHYCLSAHTMASRMSGMSDDTIDAAKRGEANDTKHQALLHFVSTMLKKRGFVSDADLNAVKDAGYDETAIIEIHGVMTVYYFTNMFNHMNETDVDAMFEPAVTTKS